MCVALDVEKAENQFITSVLYLLHVYPSYGNPFSSSFPIQIKELLTYSLKKERKISTHQKNCIKICALPNLFRNDMHDDDDGNMSEEMCSNKI